MKSEYTLFREKLDWRKNPNMARPDRSGAELKDSRIFGVSMGWRWRAIVAKYLPPSR